MGLETLIKILIGSSLYAIFGGYVNYFIYYFIYSFKYVFGVFDFVLKVLGAHQIFLKFFHYFILGYLVYYVVKLIKSFIY